MCISVVGGLKRLEQQYHKEAERMGIDLKIYNDDVKGLDTKLPWSDAIIIFTGMVSHNARRVASKTARTHGIPVFMHHACGVCTLRECLGCLKALNAVQQNNVSLERDNPGFAKQDN